MGYRLAEQGGVPEDLPRVRRDHEVVYEPIGSSATNLSGGRVRQERAWLRTWSLAFAGLLTEDQFERLRAWTDPDLHGLGPFELYEDDEPAVLVNVVALTKQKRFRVLGSGSGSGVRYAGASLTLEEVGD